MGAPGRWQASWEGEVARQLGGSRRALAVAVAAAEEEADATMSASDGRTLSRRTLLPSLPPSGQHVRRHPRGPLLLGPRSCARR